jgi:hypothetical protein
MKKINWNVTLHSFFFLCGLLMASCGVEVENPDNPPPISPKVPASERSTDAPASDTLPQGSTSQNIPIPTITCQVTLVRSESGGSGEDGAVFDFPATDTYASASLLYRTQSTQSFIEVRDQVFNSGSFSSGSFIFEFYKGDGTSCLVPVAVTADDVANKVKLTLEINFPQ